MPSRFQQCSGLIAQMGEPIAQLSAAIAPFQLEPIERREWYELLERKLRPQLGDSSFLIVAVVGGTNIGKSAIFNHIAGAKLSSSSPVASGTKHPMALIPERLSGQVELTELFHGFDIRPLQDSTQPLQESERHLLFYRTSPQTPANLIILDTPDIDSVSQVNWERADHVRQAADVLIAVLTQQKYNDAAVKQFFRRAAEEDKLVLVVLNQCLLPEDEAFWPLWMGTFCQETGIRPHAVYLAPNDRRAAEENRLPFFERNWPESAAAPAGEESRRDLMRELSDLKFGEIKLRALTGALRQLVDHEAGIPAWLREIRQRAGEFSDALNLLSTNRLVEVDRWPNLPNSVLIPQIREWWAGQREGWSASVHGFYNQLGRIVAYPVNLVRNRTRADALTPLEQYRQREWSIILEVIERTFDRLTWLRDLGNPLLTPRLEVLLSGTARSLLIERLRQAHGTVDFEYDVRQLVDRELARFRNESPESYRLFRRIDTAAAAVRPAVSVALFMTGAGPVGEALVPIVADTAIQGAVHLAGDAVGGTVVTAVGDKVLTDTAATGTGYLEAKFRQLHTSFTRMRAEWLAEQFREHLLGELPKELATHAGITEHAAYRRLQTLVNQLREEMRGPWEPEPTRS